MKTINKTSYNTEDVQAFVEAVLGVCRERTKQTYKVKHVGKLGVLPFEGWGAVRSSAWGMVEKKPDYADATYGKANKSEALKNYELLLYLEAPSKLWGGAELLVGLMEKEAPVVLKEDLIWAMLRMHPESDHAFATGFGVDWDQWGAFVADRRLRHRAAVLAAMTDVLKLPIRFTGV